jgi:D-serine deaminase-like pyridoxal phosphate-dependent protein
MLAVLAAIEGRTSVKFRGLMVYEAHVAGLVDNSPFAPMRNVPNQAFKKLARRTLATLREALANALINRGYKGFLFNGAGTGSADVAKTEHWLTEVTIGSGYLASHLFDYYMGLSLIPAATYATQVTRHPAPGFVTIQGGGFTASGGIGPDRLPVPYLPEGLGVLKDEGIGEVQSGLTVPDGLTLSLGDPVFFRHAKAGELAEHLCEYLLIRGDKVVSRAKTYRGEGQCF